MNKLFENWRIFLNEEREVQDPHGQQYPESSYTVFKLTAIAESARGSFIKTIFLNNRKSLEKKIAIRLSEIPEVKHLPTPSKFIDDIISYLNSTKILFYNTSRKKFGTDPDYGGPAIYSSSKNEIIISETLSHWKEASKARFTEMIYHEFGHAMDNAIPIGLRRAAGKESTFLDPGFLRGKAGGYLIDSIKEIIFDDDRLGGRPFEWSEPPEGSPRPTVTSGPGVRYYSEEQYKKLKSITKKGLSPVGTGVHKERVAEFFASLKSLIAVLGREINIFDIELVCWLDTAPGRYAHGPGPGDLAVPDKNRRRQLRRHAHRGMRYRKFISKQKDWAKTIKTLSDDVDFYWDIWNYTYLSAHGRLKVYEKERERAREPDLDKLVDAGTITMEEEMNGYIDRRYHAADLAFGHKFNNAWKKLRTSETMRMIDCKKEPEYIVKVLSELL